MTEQFIVDILQSVALAILAICLLLMNRRVERILQVLLESTSQIIDLNQKWRREGSLFLWTRGQRVYHETNRLE
jgi:hypothetical protein